MPAGQTRSDCRKFPLRSAFPRYNASICQITKMSYPRKMLRSYQVDFVNSYYQAAFQYEQDAPVYQKTTPHSAIQSLKTPWMGEGYAYFSHNNRNDTIIQYLNLPYPDDTTSQYRYRMNIAEKADGGLIISKMNRLSERRNRLFEKKSFHCATFGARGQVLSLKGKTPHFYEPALEDPHKRVKDLVEEAAYILSQSQNTVLRSRTLYNWKSCDIIPQAQAMLEKVKQTRHKDFLYLP